MEHRDQQVLDFAHDHCDRGAWLVTIVAASGSSPRPVGSLLACADDGTRAGSVSGGCVEEDLLDRLASGEFAGRRVAQVEYGVSAEENARLGLPCGGRLTLLLQRLGPDDRPWLAALGTAIGERRCLCRSVDLDSGRTTLNDRQTPTAPQLDGGQFHQVFGPLQRLLLVGAGELAASLAELALAMDYDVLVTDPRQSALDQWTGPAVPLLQGMPDDVAREHAADRHSLVITLTHDPRIDDMALMEALEGEAWYVGALGSRRTTEARRERLLELGVSESALARLHAPVGLSIGSKTPLEIAVAIMAELVQLRRRGPAAA
ncbi:MAG: XdhC family protein [Pseudohaliea sp.]